jgi:hypothetical protein
MNLDTAILVTTFALLGVSLLLSGRKSSRHTSVREHEESADLDALFRPVLLFTTTAPVAHC